MHALPQYFLIATAQHYLLTKSKLFLKLQFQVYICIYDTLLWNVRISAAIDDLGNKQEQSSSGKLYRMTQVSVLS